MTYLQLLRAASFGICFYACIYHLLIGLRRSPPDRINIIFAFTALAFALRNFGEVFYNAAATDGRLNDYLFWGHLAVSAYILGLIFLIWFVTFYTKARPILIPTAISFAWLVIFWVHQNSPYFYLFTEKPEFVDVTLPWGEVVTYGNAEMSVWADFEWIIVLAMIAYFIFASSRQYLRGERQEAMLIGVAVTIYMASFLHDILLDYDMINSIYILAQGFVVMIIMMSMTLSNKIIQTETALEKLNLELERICDDRTKDLVIARNKAESANRAKSVFLANMSHELRTPLNTILGNTQILTRQKKFKGDELVGIKAIDKSGEHLLDLINNILEISKIEAGQTVLTPSKFSVDALISDIYTMFAERIQLKNLTLSVEKEAYLDNIIEADRGKINQVLINLMSNAVRNTSSGSIILRQQLIENSGNEARLIIEVEDTGPGIGTDEREKIFKPFAYGEIDSSNNTGTGLGLAISRQYAELMDGNITVNSTLGKGSTFRLEIPVALVEAKSEHLAPSASRLIIGIEGDRQDYRILVVDDLAANRDVLVRMLKPVGFQIQEVAGGQEAIDSFSILDPDLVLMDIRMPEVDGLEAIKAIKSTENGRNTPIVGVSASVFEDDRKMVLDSGADDFLPKPFKENELFEKIGTHLGINYV